MQLLVQQPEGLHDLHNSLYGRNVPMDDLYGRRNAVLAI